jgi:hypothetical protein
MGIGPEKRVEPRKALSLPVLCQSGMETGSAQTVNVSISGALLESASLRPERGTLVKLVFLAPGSDTPRELIGTLVRHTETGFAIQFLVMEPAILELVGEAA